MICETNATIRGDEMTDRPILFSAPMIRALLAGAKTQTRRALKVQPIGTPYSAQASLTKSGSRPVFYAGWDERAADGSTCCFCPYGVPGDRLWVRETWQGPLLQDFEIDADADWHQPSHIHQYQNPVHCAYAADGGPAPEFIDMDDNLQQRWRPSIYMPRWASRLLLEVTEVRVERLQDISRGDAMAEGCPFPNMAKGDDPRQWYAELWEQINGPGSWDENPWVWVLSFQRIAP